jgi:hypothetical protein
MELIQVDIKMAVTPNGKAAQNVAEIVSESVKMAYGGDAKVIVNVYTAVGFPITCVNYAENIPRPGNS